MKAMLLAIAVFSTSISFGFEQQQDGPKMKQQKDVKSSTAPVTHAEAKATFEKAWKALVRGLKVKGANPVVMVSDKNPVTKDEVLAAFRAIVSQAQPKFKRSATPVTFKLTRLRKDLDQSKYGKLIKDGFVMPVGPLVVAKNEPLTTFEFGDAVGVLLVRISDLIHMPSRKFTPDLMKP